ncbi:glycine/D-amino acid oxidase-like deaminating enzyme [Haloferula luteola]|uniref:Glycine/D-amino acid oxidase-like deaminating enzyme n=1 Tax=Haloferula luteola TaxID=595692 RepID=A0A840V150_9BACT|nr:FAD-dependent oxidoreductase [Haloferula luteola]MBB5351715.1 glycine/D-amino acid oxidase-like deaminating enzyme [Haloferula luteola]
MPMTNGVEITGMGLAGCCLAWQMRARGVAVRWTDDHRSGAASRVAAGLVNPVTGKNYEPSWRIAEFLPEAVAFFEKIGEETGERYWFPQPVVRWVSEKEWPKAAAKLELPEVARWVETVEEHVEGWRARVTLKGGGRVDTRAFCEATERVFAEGADAGPASWQVHCGGAFDLLQGRFGEHRCAKGEILTVRIPDRQEKGIRIGGGGWLVPLGDDFFKAGATYEWDQLDGRPTAAGRARVEEILRHLGVRDFEVVAHEAGIRPIVRRSMPLIGRMGDVWVFNGLGSKGSLYAPGVARRLVEALVDGTELDAELDVGKWLERAG